jgi:D-glycero-D-manno-heptose 1,7-bisphosphate phosphatase
LHEGGYKEDFRLGLTEAWASGRTKELRKPWRRPYATLVQGSRAVFVDRDGVLNDLVYNEEEGQVVSPFSSRQLRVFPFVPDAIKTIRNELGFQVIVISNQPGVSKRQFTLTELERMNEKVRRALADHGTRLDGEYYCLHHPEALIPKYRVVCNCRKPKPGLLFRASKEKGIDLAESYFVGDGLVDIKAGMGAGCRTILVGHVTTFLSRLIEKEDATPDYVVPTLREVPALLRRLGMA